MNLIRHRRFPRCAAALSAVVLAACGGAPTETVTAAATEPLFAGTGPHHRPVAASSADAQAYFDQGLAFLFAFNHDEAIRSFRRAAEIDPELRHGLVGHRLRQRTAHQQPGGSAAAGGREASKPPTAPRPLPRGLDEGADRALILAVTTRYASPQPEDRGPARRGLRRGHGRRVRLRTPTTATSALSTPSPLSTSTRGTSGSTTAAPKEWTPPIVALSKT